MIDLLLAVLHGFLLGLGALTSMVLIGMALGCLIRRAGPCWCEEGPTRCGTCVDDGDRLIEGEG